MKRMNEKDMFSAHLFLYNLVKATAEMGDYSSAGTLIQVTRKEAWLGTQGMVNGQMFHDEVNRGFLPIQHSVDYWLEDTRKMLGL